LRVRITFYVPFFPVDDVEVELIDRSGKTLSRATGRSVEHPVSRRGRASNNDAIVFPWWDIVTVAGVMEVVEFRQAGPLFYISDDPALVESAKEFIKQP
jgi:hypothetical protein